MMRARAAGVGHRRPLVGGQVEHRAVRALPRRSRRGAPLAAGVRNGGDGGSDAARMAPAGPARGRSGAAPAGRSGSVARRHTTRSSRRAAPPPRRHRPAPASPRPRARPRPRAMSPARAGGRRPSWPRPDDAAPRREPGGWPGPPRSGRPAVGPGAACRGRAKGESGGTSNTIRCRACQRGHRAATRPAGSSPAVARSTHRASDQAEAAVPPGATTRLRPSRSGPARSSADLGGSAGDAWAARRGGDGGASAGRDRRGAGSSAGGRAAGRWRFSDRWVGELERLLTVACARGGARTLARQMAGPDLGHAGVHPAAAAALDPSHRRPG